jgi:uncharacterized protein YkwD
MLAKLERSKETQTVEARNWLRWGSSRPGAERVRLVAIGASEPHEFAVINDATSIGSALGNDLVIKHRTVSRQHATIARRLGRYELSDLNSTNGTFVNGHRVHSSAMISKGDELRFGSVRYAFLGGAVTVAAGPDAAGKKGEDAAAPGGLAVVARAGRRIPLNVAVGVLVLLFAIAFAVTKYIITWDRLEWTAEAPDGRTVAAASAKAASEGASGAATVGPSPAAGSAKPRVATVANHAEIPVARPLPPLAPAAAEQWLGALNNYRRLAGLAPVTDASVLSNGDRLHARYLVKNYAPDIKAGTSLGVTMHSEDPKNRWYTPEGFRAARSSDIDDWWDSSGHRASSWAIDSWMAGPFHRLWILNPGLRAAGYGEYCEDRVCVAALNIGTDAALLPVAAAPLRGAIEFPPDRSTVGLRYTEGEWPDPLTACPGYAPPAGLPITLQLGANVPVKFSSYSLVRTGTVSGSLEACGFDAATYVNPDAAAQKGARDILRALGAMVIVPRVPLEPGASYKVSVDANGRSYDWSFSTKP